MLLVTIRFFRDHGFDQDNSALTLTKERQILRAPKVLAMQLVWRNGRAGINAA